MALCTCDHNDLSNSFIVVYDNSKGQTRCPVCQLIAEKEDIGRQLETAIDGLREAQNG